MDILITEYLIAERPISCEHSNFQAPTAHQIPMMCSAYDRVVHTLQNIRYLSIRETHFAMKIKINSLLGRNAITCFYHSSIYKLEDSSAQLIYPWGIRMKQDVIL